MNKQYEGSVILGIGHSLIYNDPSKEIKTLDQLSGLSDYQASLGLYGVMTDDSIAELKSTTGSPNDSSEDFIYPIFRGLSEVIVRKSYDPIDFTKAGVLKNSLQKLIGQTIYTNHMSYIGNQVGVITKAFWDNGYVKDGVRVPAGINIEMKIDAKNNPKLAGSLTMDPPAVHSNSVTVAFQWEQSHPKMTYEEFRNKVGTFDENGEMIRRVATNIRAYTETSIVSHGADPYAKMIGQDGKIVNPHISSAMDSFSHEGQAKTNFFFMSHKDTESFGYPTTIPTEPDIKNNETTKQLKMNKDHVLFLAALSGFTVPEEVQELEQEAFAEQFDQDGLTAHLAENPLNVEAFQSLEAEKASLSAELTTLKAELEELKDAEPTPSVDQAEFSDMKAGILDELTKTYSLIKGEAPTESLTSQWGKSNYASLKVLTETYEEQLENKFPISCKSCGSKEVSRATSTPEGLGENIITKGNPSESAMDIVQRRRTKRN